MSVGPDFNITKSQLTGPLGIARQNEARMKHCRFPDVHLNICTKQRGVNITCFATLY